MKNNKKMVALLSGILVVLLLIVVVLMMKGKTDAEKVDANVDEEKEVISTVEEMIAAEEPFTIETKFCNLHYPEKWENQVSTEIKEDSVYSVQFFAELEGKDPVHIFDIVFGGEEGALTGYFSEDGKEIPVYIVGMEINVEGWTDEELNVLYMMQEDVNYIIGMLQKEAGFKAE